MLSTIAVTSPGDSGAGTLRAAIVQANLDATPDTIAFAPSAAGPIVLTSALPDLATSMTIEGLGLSTSTVTRSDAVETPNFRIFNVLAGADVTISGLTISGGLSDLTTGAQGGGIKNAGTLTVTDAAINENTASGNALNGDVFNVLQGHGGGIFNSGSLTLKATTVAGNTANGNEAGFAGFNSIGEGGGIFNTGMLSIDGGTINDNKAAGYLYSAASFGGSGAGIENTGTAVILNTLIADNAADPYLLGGGGGIDNTGTLTVKTSTIRGNSAWSGGGIGNFTYSADDSPLLTVVASTIAGNSADTHTGSGGGINNGGTASVTSSTISGNLAMEGGGIANQYDAPLTVVSSTIADNSANVYMGGGIAAGIASQTATPTTQATVIDTIFRNVAGGDVSAGNGGQLISLGHNLFSVHPQVVLQPTDLVNVDPLLGPLADNGGPTQTMALLPGSPAIGAGVAVAGVTTDQRGIPLPQGTAPDLGAYQTVGVPGPQAPTVVGLARSGVHLQPTRLVLTFSNPLASSGVSNVTNYALVRVGPHGRSAPHARTIPVVSAVYDSTSSSVTLALRRRLNLHGFYRLTVNGTALDGLTGTDGQLLDGASTGHPGSNYVAVIHHFGISATKTSRVAKAHALVHTPPRHA